MKLIIACDPNGGIGYQNRLPWTNIRGDLPRFKQLTEGQVVIMGRNTWDSLPKKPLPGRVNLVVTSRPFKHEGVYCFEKITDSNDWYWIIGGAKLISSCWPYINEIHLTKTFAQYTCDCFINLVKLEHDFNMSYEEIHEDHSYQIWKKL